MSMKCMAIIVKNDIGQARLQAFARVPRKSFILCTQFGRVKNFKALSEM